MEQVFISYKYTWIDKIELKKELEFISSRLENIWYKTYIVTRDIQKWQEIELSNKMIKESLEELKKSDIFFCYIKSAEKSEWMLIEYWYAKALGKKTIVFCKKWVNTFFVKRLADIYIEYEDLGEIEKITKL